ncbi:class A beta-lactamase [Sphingomonas parva]|uniref:Beta-lactamase n=1 Tax=Sphingomonas parva TaxID=2555898 RepID=A0A4Y8ZX04_9SPHN|nr:class A beta-lactamase [Sphingomonas parva]TFI59299.1 class A beta-lactamase [Sphingomonas parva]
MIDRRTFCAGGALLLGACAASPASPPRDEDAGHAEAALEAIRATLGNGARLGVAAIDTATGSRLLFDADSRYAMCSTFKAPLAAAILSAAERGTLSLDEEIAFGPADLLDHAPVVRANLAKPRLPVRTLCAAIVEVSDNSAANLLLARIGGPAGLTRFVRAAGDSVTRLDRTEPELNSNLPGDPRDTTSPAAFAALIQRLVLGDVLRPASRDLLAGWLRSASTGLDRLRAGLPQGWTAGDKTGTGNGANNDVAVAWRPDGSALVIASFTNGDAPAGVRNAAHAEVARLVVRQLG